MFIGNKISAIKAFTQQQRQSPHLKPLQTLVASQLDIEEEEVTPPKAFVDDLGADSLDVVEIVLGIEDEFGVAIPDEELENLITVGDMVGYLDEHVDPGQDQDWSARLASQGLV